MQNVFQSLLDRRFRRKLSRAHAKTVANLRVDFNLLDLLKHTAYSPNRILAR